VSGKPGHYGLIGRQTEDAGSDPEADEGRKVQKTEISQGDFVLQLAKTCQEKHHGRGAFYLTLSVEDFRVIEILTLGPKELDATLQCLKESLRAQRMPHDESVTGTLEL
jgi:hypothetical protein